MIEFAVDLLTFLFEFPLKLSDVDLGLDSYQLSDQMHEF